MMIHNKQTDWVRINELTGIRSEQMDWARIIMLITAHRDRRLLRWGMPVDTPLQGRTPLLTAALASQVPT